MHINLTLSGDMMPLYKLHANEIQSVYKRTYIKSAVELCGSILFLTELCQAVEAGKLGIIDVK
jgi:hypothetical protein